MVGAGALGCEVLKMLTLMGVAVRQPGAISVTDSDSISYSNLNRQFLFRQSDVGKMKSLVAAESCRSLNPEITIRPYTHVVSEVSPFPPEFWQKQSCIIGAVDNVEARRFLDEQAHFFDIPFVEGACRMFFLAFYLRTCAAGIHSLRGNTSVVIPGITTSFRGVAEQHNCFSKGFPHLPSHAVQDARELFDKLFRGNMQRLSNWVLHREIPKSNAESLVWYLEMFKAFIGSSAAKAKVPDLLKEWSERLYEELFVQRPEETLQQKPLDAVEDGGTTLMFSKITHNTNTHRVVLETPALASAPNDARRK